MAGQGLSSLHQLKLVSNLYFFDELGARPVQVHLHIRWDEVHRETVLLRTCFGVIRESVLDMFSLSRLLHSWFQDQSHEQEANKEKLGPEGATTIAEAEAKALE